MSRNLFGLVCGFNAVAEYPVSRQIEPLLITQKYEWNAIIVWLIAPMRFRAQCLAFPRQFSIIQQ